MNTPSKPLDKKKKKTQKNTEESITLPICSASLVEEQGVSTVYFESLTQVRSGEPKFHLELLI